MNQKDCPYKNRLYIQADLSCAPFSGGCDSGVDEEGRVYCDRIQEKDNSETGD